MHRSTGPTQRNFRNKTLVGAIIAALALGAAGTAAANNVGGSSTYTFDGVQTLTLQQYVKAINNTQTLLAPLSAKVLDSEAGYRGPAADGSLTVSANTFQALTQDTTHTNLLGANGADNSVDLVLLGSGGVNAGIGIVSGQLADEGVSAKAGNNNIGLDLTDYTSGNATVTDNTMNATALVNGASNRVEGALNTKPFDGGKRGGVSAHYDPAGAAMEATGGVTIGNAQIADEVELLANVTDSNITFVNAMTTSGTSSAPITVTGNTVNAADTGNRGDNRFAAAAGGAVSYAGSVGVVNGQASLGGRTRAKVTETDIGADLQDTTFGGQLDVSGNRLSAAAQGNDAAAVDANGNLVRGNVISFGQGIEVTGANHEGSLAMSFGNSIVDGDADADLALLNSQGNRQNSIVGNVGNSDIGAQLTTLDGGSLTASDNHAAASAGGNSAINMVSANGSSFDAGVAAGNQQSNDHTSIHAYASDITLGVQIGNDGGNSGDNSGDVTVSNSSIGASANGSSAQTLVDLQGTSFNASTGDAVDASANNAGYTSINAGTAGIAVGNLQANYGAGTKIDAAVGSVDLGAVYNVGGIDDSNVTVNGNAVSANASGNSASTSAHAGGAVGSLTASLGSGQYNANDINASVRGASIEVHNYSDGIDDSQVSVGNNALGATAFANQANNSLSTAFDGNLTLADGGTGSTIEGSGNQGSAGLVLLNNQINDGAEVNASLETAWIWAVSSDEISGSNADMQANTIAASAIGNNAGNSLTPVAGSLVRDGEGGTLAALGNLQQMTGGSTATVEDAGAEVYAGDVENATTTLTGNQFSAFAGGNLAGGNGVAGNALHVTGINLVDEAGAGTVASYDSSTTQQRAVAAFTLQNAQSSTDGNRVAIIDGAYIDDEFDDVGNSSLTVAGNGISTEARDNRAANLLGLDGFSALATTAALQSAQTSEGSMTSAVGEAVIGIATVSSGHVDMTVSGNTMSAKAVANTVANQLTVDAVSLDGTAGGGLLPGGAPDGYRGAVGSGGLLDVVTDYGLSNLQVRNGGDIDAGIGFADIGAVADGGDIDDGSSVTVNGNSMTVLGQGNSAGNTVGLTGSQIDATAAILNSQSMQSNVASQAEGVSIGITAEGAMDSAMPLTVTGNSVGVFAELNDAVNALNVNADSSIAGSVGLAGASDDTDSYLGFAGAVADFALVNGQGSGSAATATLEDAQAGIQAGWNIGANDGNSSLTVSGNQFTAQASGNSASSSEALNGTGGVAATAALYNTQSLSEDGEIGATVNHVTVAAGTEGDVGDIQRANVTVSGNQVSGSASGNSASNAIAASSAVLNGAGFVDTVGTTDGGAGVSTAIADYALNSVQRNDAAIGTSMDRVAIGSNPLGTDGALTASMATVSNNSVVGSAVGNSASNSILLASVAGVGMPSASLVSSQVNTAAISTAVNNVTIGVVAGIGSNSPVTVNNNTISAIATGNSVINHIGIGK
ncbi:beta strand repeat-containing protein [Rhodanobacter sp. Col0626]|uniref:beta strand repeat-containing protein n=1 Tax=Rhodanobacter sp. Col0626 TaxID=3415679 RepID=UPI003CE6E3EF